MLFKKHNIILICIPAFIIGIIVGAINYIFGTGLIYVNNFRLEHPFYLIPFLGVAGLLIVFLYKKFGKNASRGMSLVFDVGLGKEKHIPVILIPLAIISTWITHLFGGSAGREGVAVQIGATVGNKFHRLCQTNESKHTLIICGMAAGFSGLFHTPIAAVFFAMEVFTCGVLEVSTLLPVLVASYTAYATSSFIGLEKFELILNATGWDWQIAGKTVVIAVVFGLVGALFAYTLKLFKRKSSDLIENPYLRILIGGIIISILSLCLFKGRYSGLSLNLIDGALYGENIYYWDWILKLLLTSLTLAVGFQGGELTPSSAIGTSLGIVLGPIVGLDPIFAASLGFSAVFAAATNTLLAPIIMGCEIFGFEQLPYFFIVCSVAYACNLNQTIYSRQKTFSVTKKDLV